jgi:hypothetical protein
MPFVCRLTDGLPLVKERRPSRVSPNISCKAEGCLQWLQVNGLYLSRPKGMGGKETKPTKQRIAKYRSTSDKFAFQKDGLPSM